MRPWKCLAISLLTFGSAVAASVAVLPFTLAPGAPRDYSSFARTFSDSLGVLSGESTLYLDSTQNSFSRATDTARKRPDPAAAGFATGASRVVSGSLFAPGGRLRCSVELFDVAHGRVCFSYAFDKPDSLSPDRFAGMIAGLVALYFPLSEDARSEILKRVDAGSVYVRTNPSSAHILLDSADAGESPKVVENVFAGTHRLFVKHENEQTGQEITIRPHRMESVAINFPSAVTNKSDQPSAFTNTVRVVTLAAACVGAGASAYYYNFSKPRKDSCGLATGCAAAAFLAVFIVTFIF